MHMCIHIYPLQEAFENVETVVSPKTSGEEEGDISCSGDVDSSFVSSQFVNHCIFQLPTINFGNTAFVLKFPYQLRVDSLCFLELKQLENFVQQLNCYQCCVTPGCSDTLAPYSVKKSELGGAVSINFSCSGCLLHHIFPLKVL